MKFSVSAAVIGLGLIVFAVPALAEPDQAAAIRKEYELRLNAWASGMKLATTPEARDKLMVDRPDAVGYLRRFWGELRGELANEWTLEPSAWFVSNAFGVTISNEDGSVKPAFSDEISAIRNSLEANHLESSGISALCLALVSTGDPRVLTMLEGIAEENPDDLVKGVASLGIAMMLRSLGDDAEIMRRRISLIRTAILESSNVEVLGTTVAKIAEEELYVIKFLSKGRNALDLVGVDSAGRPLKLSDFRGKVVMLLFWSLGMNELDRTLEIAAGTVKKFEDRPFVLLGVNQDPVAALRKVQADGTVQWPNFSDPERVLSATYRVNSLPLAMVIDQRGVIQYIGGPGSFVELAAESLLTDPPQDN